MELEKNYCFAKGKPGSVCVFHVKEGGAAQRRKDKVQNYRGKDQAVLRTVPAK